MAKGGRKDEDVLSCGEGGDKYLWLSYRTGQMLLISALIILVLKDADAGTTRQTKHHLTAH